MKKRLLYCALFFITIILMPFYSPLADQPLNIRVGLYYDNTALNKYNLASQKGFTVGYRTDEAYSVVIRSNDTILDIYRAGYDDFTSVKENIFTKEEAITIAEDMTNRGVEAYIFYDGNWAVWSKSNSGYTSNGSLLAIRSFDNYSIVLPVHETKPVFFSSDSPISINHTSYRGTLEIVPSGEDKLQVVNELSLEEYLYGVVPKEITPTWHEEVLKAQAVAARTYAVNNLSKWHRYGFDIGSGSSDQVYGGFSAENPRTNSAVDSTKGELIYYDNKPITAFYHSDSGGVTEDSKYVFPSELPYLKPVKDIFHSDSPHARWEVSIDEINKGAVSLTREVGKIQSIDIISRSPSGRVIEVLVKGTTGEKSLINSEIRTKLNLKSTFFEFEGSENHQKDIHIISDSGNLSRKKKDLWVLSNENLSPIFKDKVFTTSTSFPIVFNPSNTSSEIIIGYGWGHGVGMSQWGAKAMAENGYNYKEILQHYYTDVKVK